MDPILKTTDRWITGMGNNINKERNKSFGSGIKSEYFNIVASKKFRILMCWY